MYISRTNSVSLNLTSPQSFNLLENQMTISDTDGTVTIVFDSKNALHEMLIESIIRYKNIVDSEEYASMQSYRKNAHVYASDLTEEATLQSIYKRISKTVDLSKDALD